MTAPNFSNRTLYISDNLPILEKMNSGTVDLVLIDPPFNSKRNYQGVGRASRAKFQDIWKWKKDVHPDWMPKLREYNGALAEVVEAAYHANDPSMAAYIAFMSIRVLELHRILKFTGSMYLHCDDTASHYLKSMMDAVFGAAQFRNHLIWRRATAHNDSKRFGRNVDHILFYTKGDKYTWNGRDIATPKSVEEIRKAYPQNDELGPVRFSDLTGASPSAGESGKPWRGYDVSARNRHWAPPKSGAYAEYIERHFIPGYRSIQGVHERLDALDAAGLIRHPTKGIWPGLKRYAAADLGKSAQALMLEPLGFTNFNKGAEWIGWGTQKPLKLYKRLIRASTNEGDMVLDAFAGCATTCVAAEQLGRQWVGIDIDDEAETITFERLRRETRLLEDGANPVSVHRDPPHPPYIPPDPESTPTFETPRRAKNNIPMPPLSEARKYLACRDGGFCQGCGFVPPNGWLDYLEVDHKLPKADGGGNEYGNLVLLCSPCNRRKAHMYTISGLRNEIVKAGRVVEKRW